MSSSKKLAIFIISPMVIVAFFSIYLRNEVIRVAYDTAALQAQKTLLIRAQKDLRVEVAQLSTLDRIEGIALEKLAMKHPVAEQRIIVAAHVTPPRDAQE